MSSLREIALDEVVKHNTRDDLWVAIDNLVYDLSDFAELHPGQNPSRDQLLLVFNFGAD